MKETVGLWRKLCVINKRLDGKIAIVTGCNTGIGLYTASELARRGATIIMACRNIERANKAKTRLLEMYGKNNEKSGETDIACSQVKSSLKPIESDQLIIEQLDLALLTSIREFVDRIKSKYNKVDFLINNAGLILQNYTTTEDGFEMTMGVNYFGPFLLTELLLPLLRNAAPSRIINVSSALHKDGCILKPDLQYSKENYNAMKAYSVSKLANVIHAIELNERLKDSGVVVVSLHPGTVKTEVLRDLRKFPMTQHQGHSTVFKHNERDRWFMEKIMCYQQKIGWENSNRDRM
ncbi:Retinol dehydrogenase 13 [Schistosoma haematobium]|uniref:Retinol dehydrogenase 13 n=1 Tax=Schistosoma haematobium TaxID=6185 RepID=A0A922LT88_SCHHA|nr:Retinol dehydrogenase 13 [Schistosoma haematobium]KAH9592719.1 Retinol dehydrogenase 13 [Schistosoma haematobium]